MTLSLETGTNTGPLKADKMYRMPLITLSQTVKTDLQFTFPYSVSKKKKRGGGGSLLDNKVIYLKKFTQESKPNKNFPHSLTY